MVDTGIIVDDAVVEAFNDLRMRRAHRHMILKITDDKTRVEIEQIGARDSDFGSFKELMPQD